MPITYGNYTKQLKLLPLVLLEEGGATCTARFGFVGTDGVFTCTEGNTFSFTPEQVSSILDATPIEGLSRRDDLSFAIYSYLVSNGLVDAGSIT